VLPPKEIKFSIFEVKIALVNPTLINGLLGSKIISKEDPNKPTSPL
jgi:hypothetical protein